VRDEAVVVDVSPVPDRGEAQLLDHGVVDVLAVHERLAQQQVLVPIHPALDSSSRHGSGEGSEGRPPVHPPGLAHGLHKHVGVQRGARAVGLGAARAVELGVREFA